MNKLSTRTKLMAGALALILAGASHAATQVGGGATLPSIGYVGTNAVSLLQVDGTSVDAHSLFGAYATASGNGVSYCLTGSGAGKNILANLSGSGVQMNCVKDSTGTVHGFGAVAVSRTDLTQPNFAGADSPLAATDITNYHTGHGSTAFPTQFPAVAGAVAIGFNLTDSLGNKVTGSEVNFTDAQLCGIFSGQITNWNDSRLASAFHLIDGGSIVSAPINVQYRSDGSGTTFSFSNHLSNVCGSINSAFIQTSQNFTNVVLGFPGNNPVVPGVLSAIPANWTGSSGNPAVATAINSTANSIGYLEAANAANSAPHVEFADVNGKSPTADFGLSTSPIALSSSSVVFNEVISPTNNANGTAALTAISGAPSTKCIALVPPVDYAVPGSRGGIVPAGTYPIVAISYLMGNAQGNLSSDLPITQGLVNAPYNATIQSNVTTIGAGTGLAFLKLNSGAFGSTTGGDATVPGSCLH